MESKREGKRKRERERERGWGEQVNIRKDNLL